MEEFESSSLDASSGLSSWWEKNREQSEKQRESYKKAQAQIQRSQKDEKKAKWDNEDLFGILERFIQNPYYEELIPLVTQLLSKSVPSRYILWIIALFYPEATIYVLNKVWQHSKIDIFLSLHRHDTLIDFNETELHPSIRSWISTWIYAVQAYITQDDMSRIIQKKLYTMLSEDPTLLSGLSEGLSFFFQSRNLRINKNMMIRYAQHINSEYINMLSQSLSTWDQALFDEGNIDTSVLFGLDQEKSSQP